MLYIAGLRVPLHRLPLSHNQGLDTIAWASTLSTVVIMLRQINWINSYATKTKGPITVLPTTLTARITTPVHFIIQLGVPALYIGAIALNGWEQPLWLQDWAFPDEFELTLGLTIASKAIVRTVASLGLLATTRLIQAAITNLGSEWAVTGIREKGKTVVRSGPFAWIRHPTYSAMLMQQLLYAGMFWSYLPLAGFVGLATAFRVKAGFEEKLIEDSNPTAGSDYRQYKRDVPGRFIPYLW